MSMETPDFERLGLTEDGELSGRSRPSWRGMRFEKRLRDALCHTSAEDMQRLAGSAACRRLVRNDGTKTFLVHSTHQENVDQIMETGLRTRAVPAVIARDQRVSGLWRTTIMLAGPHDKPQEQFNLRALAYRKSVLEPEHWVVTKPPTAKLVFAFDETNPGTCYRENPLHGTFLEQPDGVRLLERPGDGMYPYQLAPQTCLAAIDLLQGSVEFNPDFELR